MASSIGEKQSLLVQRQINPFGMSDREVQLVTYLSNGYSIETAAHYLRISRSAANNTLVNARKLMGCASSFELGPRWTREVELERMRVKLSNVLIAIDAVDAMGKLRQHKFVMDAKQALVQS